MPVCEAHAEFGVRDVFDLRKAPDDDVIVVWRGAMTVDSIPLDFCDLDRWVNRPETGSSSLIGMIVDGDCEVAEHIVNGEIDFGPFLWVRGDLRTKNIAVAGSEVVIEGRLDAVQTITGTYNHGSLVVRGDATAEVVFPNDYLMVFHAGLDATLVVADQFLRIAQPGAMRVKHWAGAPAGLDGQRIGGLGAGYQAMRMLHHTVASGKQHPIWQAAREGRSLLVHLSPPPPPPPAPVAAVRAALLAAGHHEYDSIHGGFVIDDNDDCERTMSVYYGIGEEQPEHPDSIEQRDVYADILTAAGFVVSVDDFTDGELRVSAGQV